MPTQGSVKWFDPKKGYGFLVGPEGQDVFIHYSHILGDGFRTLADGDLVDYELISGEKGFQAQNVLAAPKNNENPATQTSTAGAAPVGPGHRVESEAEAQRRHAHAVASVEDDGEEGHSTGYQSSTADAR